MYDSNNREIRTGDFVTVSGAYFKNNNGLWLVTEASDAPDYMGDSVYLHKVKKSGELCVESAGNSMSLPLHYYCSDWKKNHAAKEHDAVNLRYEVTEGVNTHYAAEYYRNKIDGFEKRIPQYKCSSVQWQKDEATKMQGWIEYYAAVVERLEQSAQPPKNVEPENGIRFYQNGIKVDGGRLIPCFYSIDNSTRFSEGVTIYAREYSGDLPSKYFAVENNSDGMSDYFEKDHADVLPHHPLYKYVRYVAYKARAKDAKKCIESDKKQLTWREPWPGHFDSLRKRIAQEEKHIADFEKMKDPGQPTVADLEAVEELKTAKETARLAAEHAERLAVREENLRKISEGRHWCEGVAAEHPIKEGAPTVEIGFSESPYLYSFSHGADNVFSVAAAEIILKHYDEMKHAEKCGYDKTDFIIRWTDEETGETREYKGRYDLGDGDGGLIEHIRAFGRYYRTHDEHSGKELAEPPQELSEVEKLADWLETFTEGGRIVNVEIAPGVIDLLEYRKKQEQQKKEQVRESVQDMYDAVAMLTDEQIEAAVFCIDPEDKEKIDVARFFLQELTRRDEKRALEVFRRWRGKEA